MRKQLVTYTLFFLFILITTPTVSASSPITIKATIDEGIHVTFSFTDIEPQLYNEIKTQGIFNISTIPNAIKEYFEQENLTSARVIYDLNQEIFNDDANSINVKFLLAGSDIVSYTLNKTDMARTFRVRTDWRKFQVSLTKNFSINFEEHFGDPLSEWQQINHGFEKSVKDDFEMSFQFVLPEKSYDIKTEEDTIIFKVPITFEDTLLNSPFLILGAILIANIIVLVYRKVRK